VFAHAQARTGIDIGTTSIKLVRLVGRRGPERVTHLDREPWDGSGRQDRARHAAEALAALLRRNHLKAKQLGRLAVASGWQEHSLREVALPRMTSHELARSLPFEAPNHLDLEGMEQPVLGGQVLGPDPEEKGKVRVLLAAVPRQRRDFALDVLRGCDLVPQVVDLEALAGLNALFRSLGEDLDETTPVGLLDLGGHHTALHISSHRGGLLSRNVAPGAPADPSSQQEVGFLVKLVSGVQQTLTYYRTREKRDVAALYLTGGGCGVEHRAENLRQATHLPVSVLDPLAGLETGDDAGADDQAPAPVYTTACGLCRWGDEDHV